MEWVGRGGRLVLAGPTGVERCFGLAVSAWDPPEERTSPGVSPLPAPRWVLARVAPTEVRGEGGPDDVPFDEGAATCVPLRVARETTLHQTVTGRAVARRLELEGGGRVTVISDAALVSNRALKETDAGVVVLPWVLDLAENGVAFDEYHQGFGVGGSIWSASWRWAVSAPAGWALLQLVFAALLAIGAAAVRFGPALHVVERRRRSPVEHLEALAAGLEGAAAHDTAVELIVAGLRRRLSARGATLRPRRAMDWLASLSHAARTQGARAAVARLTAAVERPESGGVLAAARATEDLWEALQSNKSST